MLALCCSCAEKAASPAVAGMPANFIPYLAENGLYGYADRQGRLVIPAEFAEAEPFVNNRAAARPKNSEKWGLIDGRGQWLVKPQFTSLSNYPQEPEGAIYREGLKIPLPGGSDGMFSLYPKKLTVISNKSTEFVILPDNTVVEQSNKEAPALQALQDQDFPFPAEVVASARAHQVLIITTPIMGALPRVTDIYVYTPSGEGRLKRMGFMSKTGELLTKAEYIVHFREIEENVPLCVEQNGKFGFFGYNGKMLYEPQFDDVDDRFGSFFIKKENRYAIMNKTGTLRTDFIFSGITRQVGSTNLFQVTMPDGRNTIWDLEAGRLWAGGIDCADAIAIDTVVSDSSQKLLAVCKDIESDQPGVHYVVFTSQGKNLGIYHRFKSEQSEDILWLKNMEDKWGAFDREGNPAIPFLYDCVSPSAHLKSGQQYPDLNDVVKVTRDGKAFYVDGNGREYRETR